MRWGQRLWNSMKTMKSYVSSTCDYRRSLAGKSDQGWHFCGRTRRHPHPPQNCYYVLVLRGKHVQQRSANSKVIHQQNEIINVINTCSHASIFCCLEIGPGGGGVVGVRGGGRGEVGLIFLTSGNCQLPEGCGLAFIKTPSAISVVAPRCLG